MFAILYLPGLLGASLFRSRRQLEAENLFLRHHGVMKEARQYTLDAIAVLAQPMQTAKSESVRLNAAEAILSRGWGRSVQAFQIDSQFAAKKLNELTEIELAQFEARLASANVEPQMDEQTV